MKHVNTTGRTHISYAPVRRADYKLALSIRRSMRRVSIKDKRAMGITVS